MEYFVTATADMHQNGGGSALPVVMEFSDLSFWHELDPARHAVTSAIALTVEKKNRGKQKVVRALMHLANDQVFFLSLTHTMSDVALLLEAIGQSLIDGTKQSLSRSALEALAGDSIDCTLLLLDEDAGQPVAWQLERWRMQRSCELVREYCHRPTSEISAYTIHELAGMTMTLAAATSRFIASLDPDILYAANQPGVFNTRRYNYLAHPDAIVRRNRRQAVEIYPLLVGEILNQPAPTPLTTQLGKIIDSGQKITTWIPRTFHVRQAPARALRHLSESDIGEGWRGKLHLLLFLLSTLPPERYPKSSEQWQAFNAALQFIKTTTGQPASSTSTGILLGDVARRNWQLDTIPNANLDERARCIDAFITNLGSALAAHIRVEKLGTHGNPTAQAQALASNALIRIGLRRVESLAAKWQTLKREADSAFAKLKPDGSFPLLLSEPFNHDDLTIVQLCSQQELNTESTHLGHCVESYGAACQHGQSLIFSVRDRQGQSRSTFEMALKTLFLASFDIRIIQHKARLNAIPGRDDKQAVSAFFQFLKGPDALPLLLGFSRERLLANLEPTLARDYRYAALMSSFLAKSMHGRTTFEALISSVVNQQSVAR